jgi:predicted nucleic acid-binding protein
MSGRVFEWPKDKGLRVTGTLGLLDLAGDRGLIDFAEAIRRLERTNFRTPRVVLEALLSKHK